MLGKLTYYWYKNTRFCSPVSGDPNNEHSVNGNIRLMDFTIAGSLPDKIYWASEKRRNCLVFKWWSEYRTKSPLFRCPVTVCYSNGIWIADNFVRYSNGGLYNGPVDDRTVFDHLMTELVHYSDPHILVYLNTV